MKEEQGFEKKQILRDCSSWSRWFPSSSSSSSAGCVAFFFLSLEEIVEEVLSCCRVPIIQLAMAN